MDRLPDTSILIKESKNFLNETSEYVEFHDMIDDLEDDIENLSIGLTRDKNKKHSQAKAISSDLKKIKALISKLKKYNDETIYVKIY